MTLNKVAIAGSLLCNVLGCTGFLVFVDKANTANAAVDRAEEVRNQVELLYRACLDAETGQRGYLLTGRDYYLQPHVWGVLAAREKLAIVREQLPDRSDEVERLSREIEDKFEELDETIKLVRAGEKPKAYTVVDSDRGKKSMERIRAAIDDLLAKETKGLFQKRLLAANSVKDAIATALGCMVLSVILAGLGAMSRTRVVLRLGVGDGVA